MINGKMSLRGKLLFGLVFATYALLTYWMLWPYKPNVVKEPIRILNPNKQVAPGDDLIYEMDRISTSTVPGEITRQLINEFVISYAPQTGTVPTGKAIFKVRLKLPSSADPGKYKMKWTGAYKVNPIRTVYVTAWSEEFEVLPARKE